MFLNFEIFLKQISPICLPWKNQGNSCEDGKSTVIGTGWGLLQTKGEPCKKIM